MKPVLGDRLSCDDQHLLQYVPERRFTLQSARRRSHSGDLGWLFCTDSFFVNQTLETNGNGVVTGVVPSHPSMF
jgi:hypothetical protein